MMMTCLDPTQKRTSTTTRLPKAKAFLFVLLLLLQQQLAPVHGGSSASLNDINTSKQPVTNHHEGITDNDAGSNADPVPLVPSQTRPRASVGRIRGISTSTTTATTISNRNSGSGGAESVHEEPRASTIMETQSLAVNPTTAETTQVADAPTRHPNQLPTSSSHSSSSSSTGDSTLESQFVLPVVPTAGNNNNDEFERQLQTIANDEPRSEGCRFVGADGSVTTFEEGQSMGTFAMVSSCANNIPEAFPCYCIGSAPGQTVCPYCYFRDTFNQIICGRGENEIGILHPNRTFIQCHCSISVTPVGISFDVDVSSDCGMVAGVTATYADPTVVASPTTTTTTATTVPAPTTGPLLTATAPTTAAPIPAPAPTSVAPILYSAFPAVPITAAPITAPPITAAPITAPPITAAPITAAPITAPGPPPTSSQPTLSPPTTITSAATTTPANNEVPVMITYQPGNLTVSQLGLRLSTGLSARIIAISGQPVQYEATNTALSGGAEESDDLFHARPDGADVFPDSRSFNTGGYIFVSNSEIKDASVGALTFDYEGNVVHYQRILRGAKWLCNGGRTPWNTWAGAEEDFDRASGVVWQVDPLGLRQPQVMTMGSDGGVFEAFAYDTRNLNQPRFFLTEDDEKGALRRWTPDQVTYGTDPFNLLHGPGLTEYLILQPDNTRVSGTFRWTTDEKSARDNAKSYYPSSEGIEVDPPLLYFVIKSDYRLFTLNLDDMTYTSASTRGGLFEGEPDQVSIILQEDGTKLLYFSEDWANVAGIHARDESGRFFTILEAPDYQPETTGITFSPDGTHMYFTMQDDGVMFDVTRDDKQSFYAKTVNLKPRFDENPARYRRQR